MFTTRRGRGNSVASQRFAGLEFSTDPGQLYVSYLTADQLAASIQRIDDKLLTMSQQERRKRGELLKTVRRDLSHELSNRQLTLMEFEDSGQE